MTSSLIGTFLLLHGAPLHAYVMPGLQLMDLMTRHMGIAHTLQVSQRVESPGPQAAVTPHDASVQPRNLAPAQQGQTPSLPNVPSPTQWQETLSYMEPGSFRLESLSGNQHRVTLLSGDAVLTTLDGRQVPQAPADRLNQYMELLCFSSRDVLQAHLVQGGLDVMTSSIGRFHGTPCWILGAQYPDPTAQQIWIAKETFLPFRWLLPHVLDDGTVDLLEFRFLKWEKKDHLWYPMLIQIMKGDVLVREIHVERVQVDPSLDSKLFDMKIEDGK